MTALPPKLPNLLNSEPAGELFRLSVDQYLLMGRHGILTPEHRVELIDGFIRNKPMHNTPHIFALAILTRFLIRQLSDDWFTINQSTVRLAESSPEPDIAVVIGPMERYREQHATPNEIALIIEVSDSTYEFDSTTKAQIYATNGIPVYWIVNIPERRVEVYSSPLAEEQRYTTLNTYTPGQQIPTVLMGQQVAELEVSCLFS
jgi:Uma2 family endonuclease